MPSLGESAEGMGGTAQVTGADGRKAQCTVLEKRDQLGEHLLDAVGAGIGNEVESYIGDVRVGRRDDLGGANVGFAHFNETAAVTQQAQGGVDEFVS
jgi:hypothetical protein